MSTNNSTVLASLRFEGDRFSNHSLDVECTQELNAYRTLVLECAKVLWHRKFPDRSNLPKGFEKNFRLQFSEVSEGSALISLKRPPPELQTDLDWGDEFDEAASLVDAAITAANADALLPEAFPTNVIPLFRDFGKTLLPEEILYTRSRHNIHEAAYTVSARQRLTEWVGSVYEDVVDIVGEVRMASIKPASFTLQPDGTEIAVTGRFNPEQEAEVLDALRNHLSMRLRVKGLAEFSMTDRQLRKFLRVDFVSPASWSEPTFDDTATPVWEQLTAIGESAPKSTWDEIPADMSIRMDEIVYQRGMESK